MRNRNVWSIYREIFEELGLKIKNLKLFGVYQSTKERKIDTIITFFSNDLVNLNEIKINNEIKHVDFYNLNNLSENISSGTYKRIQEYLSKDFPVAKKW